MIVLYTGRPGAGKTYRVVNTLMDGSLDGKYVIFHNIEGLREGVVEDGKYIHSFKDIPNFLSYDKQKEICEYEKQRTGRSVLVIIDESQNFLGDKTADMKKWLSWHRHNGQDVWLIAQHNEMIHRDYRNLIEYEIRAKKGVTLSSFVYQYSIGGEKWKTDRVKTSKAVFASYQSFTQGETKKGKSHVMVYAVGLAVLCLTLGVYMIGWGIPSTFAKTPPGGLQRKAELPKRAPPGPVSPPVAVVAAPSPYGSVSFVSVMGPVVYVESEDGRIQKLEDAGIGTDLYQVVNSSRSGVIIQTARGLETINRRGLKYKEKLQPTSYSAPTVSTSAGALGGS